MVAAHRARQRKPPTQVLEGGVHSVVSAGAMSADALHAQGPVHHLALPAQNPESLVEQPQAAMAESAHTQDQIAALRSLLPAQGESRTDTLSQLGMKQTEVLDWRFRKSWFHCKKSGRTRMRARFFDIFKILM